jgi:hypothetical protein
MSDLASPAPPAAPPAVPARAAEMGRGRVVGRGGAKRASRALMARLGCVVLAAVGVLAVPAAAQAAETEATIKTSFSPDRLGAKAAFTFTVHFTGGEFGVPSPVRHAVVQLPPGLSMNIPSIRSCTSTRLKAHGAKGCPKRSQIGVGSALADVHAGAGIEDEEAKVWAFLGPLQAGNPTIEILGEGFTPLEERVVITATVLPSQPPYGEELEMTIPPIPSIPLEPDASTASFTLTVGGARFRMRHPNTVVLPSHCPAGGFPFATEFTYADGSTSTTKTTVPCP